MTKLIKEPVRYKRYLVFTYSDYYPCGGLEDIKEQFNTYEEVKDYLLSYPDYYIDNLTVFDCETREEIQDQFEVKCKERPPRTKEQEEQARINAEIWAPVIRKTFENPLFISPKGIFIDKKL